MMVDVSVGTGILGGSPERFAQGMYLNPPHNFQLFFPSDIRDRIEKYPTPENEVVEHQRTSDDAWDEDTPNTWYIGAYGVVDNPVQWQEHAAGQYWTGHPTRKFAVCFTRIDRAEQDAQGGWRWHKWGPYIGNQRPTAEYLYDEPDIETVYTFHVYEIL